MKKRDLALLLSPLLLLLPGCQKSEAPVVEKMATPAQASSIVIEIGEGLTVLHEAQPGQTLVWRSNSPNTPPFWIQFGGKSPCANGALVLSGSASKAASCVVSSPAGLNGTVTYSYSIRTSSPPLPSPGDTDDRITRCIGCNN